MGDRHSARASWHHYCGGVYFVTICAAGYAHIFGEINNNHMRHSKLGEAVAEAIKAIPDHYPDAEIQNYVVMPNHVHLMVAINSRAPMHTETQCWMFEATQTCIRNYYESS